MLRFFDQVFMKRKICKVINRIIVKCNRSWSLNVGDLAPNFELPDTELKMRTLDEFKGKKIVLSFIVAASSPVCEVELCTFRDSWQEISDMGAQIISISNDGPFANKAFAEKHNFNFPLLGDYTSKTIKDYDILLKIYYTLKITMQQNVQYS